LGWFIWQWFFFLLCALIPIKSYSNAETNKATILQDNKDKSGIYMWRNLINGKKYIGSAIDFKISSNLITLT
jgi:hypothetical protein